MVRPVRASCGDLFCANAAPVIARVLQLNWTPRMWQHDLEKGGDDETKGRDGLR